MSKLNPSGTALLWSTYLGGSNFDSGLGIALDASGNAYVTGATSSSDFPTTAGAFQTTQPSAFNEHVFVTKLGSAGTLVYSTYVGGNGDEQGNAIAVDSAGDALVTGVTNSTDFPTQNPYQSTEPNASLTGFVTELNPAGSALVYSTYLGGQHPGPGVRHRHRRHGHPRDRVHDVDELPRHLRHRPGRRRQGRLRHRARSGRVGAAQLVSSALLGGSGDSTGFGIALDGAGDAYVTGSTTASGFPTTAGALQTTFSGSTDAFVTELNPTASALVYSTFLGGSAGQEGQAVAVDSAGDAFVAGTTTSTDFPTTAGAPQTVFGGGPGTDCNSLGGGCDAFVSELDPSGGSLLFSTFLGGSSDDRGEGIALHGGDAFVCGATTSSNFPVTPDPGAVQTSRAGGEDAFVTGIIVAVAPVITVNPLSQTVTAGSTVTFTAAATGTPAPTVQWLESTDGGVTFTPITGATSTTLTLTGVTTAESGDEFEATFTNVAGSATTAAAVLTVVVAPAITLNPVSQTVTAGSTVTFTAAATGTPTPTVQWLESTDGGVTFTAITGATSTTLTLTGVTAAESGDEFEATFTNVAGSATTTAAVLTVTPAAPPPPPPPLPPLPPPPPPPPPPPAAATAPPPAAAAPPAAAPPAAAPPAAAPPAPVPAPPSGGAPSSGGAHGATGTGAGRSAQQPGSARASTASPSPTPSPVASPSPTPSPRPSPTPRASAPSTPTAPSPPATGFGANLATPAQALPNLRAALIDAVLVLVLVAFVAFPAQLFNSTYLANQSVIDAWWARRLRALRRLAPPRAPAAVQLALVTLAGSVLGALVDPDTPLSGATVGLGLAILVSIALRGLVAGTADSRWRRTTPSVVSVPSGLIVALACLLVSRALTFRPGYLYGVVVGVGFPREFVDREARSKVVQSVTLLVLSLACWLLWVPVASAVATPGSGEPLRLLRDVLAVTVVSGLLGLIFTLLPLRFLQGDVIWRWSRRWWVALYATVAFFFIAVLVRPELAPGRRPMAQLVTALTLLVAFGAASVAFWLRFRGKESHATTK